MPLPPYITTRSATPAAIRRSSPCSPGSAAAPTAGLHFTPRLLRPAGIGRGDDGDGRVGGRAGHVPTDQHRRPARPPHAHRALSGAGGDDAGVPRGRPGRRRRNHRSAGARIGCQRVASSSGRTDIFIHHGFDWQVVDVLMTNFHLPKTTLLMMIDAFVGERWTRPVRRSARGRLPLLVVRRRHAARPTSHLNTP